MNDNSDTDSPWPLLIPIAILVIVMYYTEVTWLLIPIVILLCVFAGNLSEEKKIEYQRRYPQDPVIETKTPTSGHTPAPKVADEKSIYDRKKQKEEGIAFGTLIPIAILTWLFLTSQSWVFLIPVFFLIWSFINSIIKRFRGRTEVHEELDRGEAKSIPEISDRTGLSEEQVRRHVVREKRRGGTDIWFDSSTGERTPIERVGERPQERQKGCKYCGFALRYEDRFCPYCGAPIMAESHR